ncbi:LON peptidase substrate-binding domain-containing protein [Acidisphaera rubrifaciens]|nr:LON peptidase substrate-binding domain-containing protein [Acidisphaera rubrifaciens]
MAAPRPDQSGLPRVFPVFPLTGALLLPQGKLPLNIFEPRYLAMVEDALAQGRMFGMIQPDPALPRGETGPGLYTVGCLGRLSSFSETEDGRYLITLTGIARFRVTKEVAMQRGYRRVEAVYDGFEDDLAPDMDALPVPRADLVAALRGYFDRAGLEANWDAVSHMPDETLVTTLCMVCPFSPPEKQALLEAPGAADRAHALYALLRMGGHDSPGGAALAS